MYLYPILSALGALLVLTGEITKKDNVPPGQRDWSRVMIISGSVAVILVALKSGIDAGVQQGRLETLAGETKSLVTGGNSLVWVRLIEDPRKPGRFTGDLVHTGDTVPSFDIDIEIVETGECDELEKWTVGQSLTSGVGNPRLQFIPAYGPQTMKTLRGHFEPSCDQAYYLIVIQTRNRSVLEQILLKRIKGKWRTAIRVQELDADKTLLDEIESGFSGDGENIKWPDLKLVRQALDVRFGS